MTVVGTKTAFVPTANCTVDVPFNAVTVPGTLLSAEPPLSTVKVTAVSALSGTGNITVPVLAVPPVTEAGEKLTDEGRSAVTVKIPVFEPPFAVPRIFT